MEDRRIRSFQDLIVWQKADLMFDMAREDAAKFPNNRIAWIVSKQFLRSIGSISANIAEGLGSGYRREFIHSLKIARKENSESFNWLIKCVKRGFISEERFSEYKNLTKEIRLMVNSLISKLNKCNPSL